MEVVCEVMKLKEESVSDYLEMHRNTWPELISAIRDSGFTEEYIFILKNIVMVVLKTENYTASSKALAEKEVFRRWTSLVRNMLIEDKQLFGTEEKVLPLDPIWRLSDFS